MRQSLAIVSGILLAALPAAAQSKADQAQVVTNAEITKIDIKKKSLQVRNLVEPVATPRNGGGGRSGGGQGGRGRSGGGGRRSGGIGFPGGGTGGRGGGNSPNPVKEYKVFVSKDTVMKLAETNIEFSDLHVGDRIIVSGTPKGSKGDIDAVTITRTFQ